VSWTLQAQKEIWRKTIGRSPMISRISYLKNMGVFVNFNWTENVKSRNGVVADFKKINVIYGRNYSGKTTLSRVFRGLERRGLPDGYGQAEFEVVEPTGSTTSIADLSNTNLSVRVFNDDFVRENLRFIFDPDEDLNSFAILGSSNAKVEEEISRLVAQLGSSDEVLKTGLHLDHWKAEELLRNDQETYNQAFQSIDAKLRLKALDRGTGIKYRPERFGDQNYTVAKLTNELEVVLGAEYNRPGPDDLDSMQQQLLETPKQPAKRLVAPGGALASLCSRATELLERRIGETGKIAKLVENAVLNRWVSEGRILHKGRETNCSFCDNKVSDSRWDELNRHFDQESEKLEADIRSCLEVLKAEAGKLVEAFRPLETEVYQEFRAEVNMLKEKYGDLASTYLRSLETITEMLTKRLEAILSPLSLPAVTDSTEGIKSVFDQYELLRSKSEAYTSKLKHKQEQARHALRLVEVHDFGKTIDYLKEVSRVQSLEATAFRSQKGLEAIDHQIDEVQRQIASKRRELNDEEEGAKKVNEYLTSFFGHEFLSLQAIEEENVEVGESKKIKFRVVRDNQKAHHLSEGECSLVAFCYFVAKLRDTETVGKLPVIWIDDPISSLDANHIFFLYSLIKAEIVDKNIFDQLFISTHNLEFLKFLKRLNGGILNTAGKYVIHEKGYYMVSRDGRASKLSLLPKYLQDYVTEFNYLFSQIHHCSTIGEITDKNYTVFYNFGNNARKFLEIYLYYRYPDNTDDTQKLKRFFASEPVPSVLLDRMNNEYSHLAGSFERGAIPVDAPEMKKSAQMIIKRLKEIDEPQYNSLVASIGS